MPSRSCAPIWIFVAIIASGALFSSKGYADIKPRPSIQDLKILSDKLRSEGCFMKDELLERSAFLQNGKWCTIKFKCHDPDKNSLEMCVKPS